MTTPRYPTVTALSAALLPLLAACGTGAEPAAATGTVAVPVTVSPVGEGARALPVTATGTFGARDEIPLAFKIGGVVQQLLVDAGQTVRRGQVLAALDQREIDAAVAKARVGVDKAQRDWARVQRLVADSVATAVQLQDAQSALDAAKADLATAAVNREYATITAPEAGVVLQRLGTPGTTVGPGQPILLLGGSRRGRVLRVALPDRDALLVALGDPATVRFEAAAEREYRGRVVLISQAADPRTGTYGVEIALSGADALPSGLIGAARIAVRSTGRGLRLPVDALVEAHGDSATVYTVAAAEAPVAQRARVRVVRLVGDEAVVEGLATDAPVITKGAAYVTTGTRVRLITPATLDSALAPVSVPTSVPTPASTRRGGARP